MLDINLDQVFYILEAKGEYSYIPLWVEGPIKQGH